MLAFLIPHQDTNKSVYDFITSVDQIEKITGTDFFYQLPDHIEVRLERKSSSKGW